MITIKVDYVMDIINKKSIGHTPGIKSKGLPFYVEGCGDFLAGKKYYTEREGFNSYILIYTLSGKGYLKYGGSEYSLMPNQAVIFDCRNYQYYSTSPDKLWNFKWLHFNGAAVKEYYRMLNNNSLSIVKMNENSRIVEMLDEIYELISSKDMLLDLKICTILVNIITQMITCKMGPLNDKKYYKHKSEIDKVIHFVNSNYDRQISIDDMTNLIFISKYHFLRLFKSYTGLTPYKYLINYRINRSKSLIKETSLSINEISNRVGFTDVNNFIRYFKKLTGTTPLNYKKYWVE